MDSAMISSQKKKKKNSLIYQIILRSITNIYLQTDVGTLHTLQTHNFAFSDTWYISLLIVCKQLNNQETFYLMLFNKFQ